MVFILLVDVGGANPWFVLVGEGFVRVAGGLFVGGGSAALVVVGVLVSWMLAPVGNRWLVGVGWFVVGIVWFGKCVLCFFSKKADKELTFLFSPLFIPVPNIWYLAGFLQGVIAEFIADVIVIAEGEDSLLGILSMFV